jgi:hypothetical protein
MPRSALRHSILPIKCTKLSHGVVNSQWSCNVIVARRVTVLIAERINGSVIFENDT